MVLQGRRAGEWFAIVDDTQVGGPYDGFAPGGIVIAGDSKRLGFVVKAGDSWKAIVDGNPEATFPTIIQRSWVFAPDSRTFAYIAALSGTFVGENFVGLQAVVVNGEIGRMWRYDAAHSHGLYHELIFSPNSKRLAYGATEEGVGVFVVDGRPDIPRGGLVSGWQSGAGWQDTQAARRAGQGGEPLMFSPDSERYAYAIATARGHEVIMDGRSIALHAHILTRPIQFSSNSKHFVYATQTASRDRQLVWLDGERVLCRSQEVLPIRMAFSPDSSKLAYAVLDGGRPFLGIDDNMVPLAGSPLRGSQPVWIDDRCVTIVTRRGNRLLMESVDA